ncbi:acyl-CoA thioesterase [Sulfurimonas sp. MAG313]|nr:acyl-CoA thioesterase [Sulfurimonas sp. MAG313]MDF1880958.1 acyl-CoA thioesterase [Sulfurimonas sp. MAG313]
MSAVFTYSFTVNEDPKNYIRHVNNLSYLQWFIDAAIMHSETLGWGMQECKKLGLAWVVKSHNIEYLREAHQEDKLIIYTWIHKVDKTRSTRLYKCIRADNKKLVAKAETLWVLVDYETGRPKAIPKDLLKKFTLVKEEDAP